LWDFGDGTLADVRSPIHSYADEGTYDVTLVVSDEDGSESEPVARTLSVTFGEPVAAFALASASIVSGESVRFVDMSISPDPEGSIVHVAWDFGDGTYHAGGPSADDLYEHTYASTGTFMVTLYVVDQSGGMSSVQQIVSVS
jgi:PKD repeat protein